MPFGFWGFPDCDHGRIQRKSGNRTGSSLFRYNLCLWFEKIIDLPVTNWNLRIRKWTPVVNSVDLSFATNFINRHHNVVFLEEAGVEILHLEKLFFNVYFVYFWERERERERAGEGQKERETENSKQAVGCQRRVTTPGLNSQTMRSWLELKSFA